MFQLYRAKLGQLNAVKFATIGIKPGVLNLHLNFCYAITQIQAGSIDFESGGPGSSKKILTSRKKQNIRKLLAASSSKSDATCLKLSTCFITSIRYL